MTEREKTMDAMAKRVGRMKPDARELLLFVLAALSEASAKKPETVGPANGRRGRVARPEKPQARAAAGSRKKRGRKAVLQPAILSALGETSVLTAREIADAVGRFGYSAGEAGPGRVLNRVHVALRKLRDQGQVERIGHGQGYRLKETS